MSRHQVHFSREELEQQDYGLTGHDWLVGLAWLAGLIALAAAWNLVLYR